MMLKLIPCARNGGQAQGLQKVKAVVCLVCLSFFIETKVNLDMSPEGFPHITHQKICIR